MSELLQVSGITSGCFLSGGWANLVCAHNVDVCVMFAVEAVVGPSAHARRIGGFLMTLSCPFIVGYKETSTGLVGSR